MDTTTSDSWKALQRRAFFPISVGNPRFSKGRTIRALEGVLSSGVDEVLFLVADQLHWYNKARGVASWSDLGATLEKVRCRSRQAAERTRWLERILTALESNGHRFTSRVMPYDACLDAPFVQIHRALLMAFATVTQFRLDIETAVAQHLDHRFHRKVSDEWHRLAHGYLLEEIALNLRVRVWERLGVEFYLGTYHLPLTNLYHGRYAIDISTLTGVPTSGSDYRFYRLEDELGMRWVAA